MRVLSEVLIGVGLVVVGFVSVRLGLGILIAALVLIVLSRVLVAVPLFGDRLRES